MNRIDFQPLEKLTIKFQSVEMRHRIGDQLCAVANGGNFDAVCVNTIDDPVVVVDFFTECFVLVFRNDPSHLWKRRNGLHNRDDFLCKNLCVGGGVHCDVLADILKLIRRAGRPYYAASHFDILFSTTSCGIPFPSSSSRSPVST